MSNEGGLLIWLGTRALGAVVSLSEDQLEFFQIHGPADIEHSNLDWGNVAKFAEHISVGKIMSFVHAARIWWCGKRI